MYIILIFDSMILIFVVYDINNYYSIYRKFKQLEQQQQV